MTSKRKPPRLALLPEDHARLLLLLLFHNNNINNLWSCKIVYLQVNALSDWIIGLYVLEITNNEGEISIPRSAVLKVSSSLLVKLWGILADLYHDSGWFVPRYIGLWQNNLLTSLSWCNSRGIISTHHGHYTMASAHSKFDDLSVFFVCSVFNLKNDNVNALIAR